MVRESFKIYMTDMAMNALQWSTMVKEKFEICMTEMAINAL